MKKNSLFVFLLLSVANFQFIKSFGQVGVTVAGGNGYGAAANQLANPYGMAVDANGNIYVCDAFNNRIQKWVPGATEGITVIGGNGPGPAANQINAAWGIFVDASGAIYVADQNNDRISKWLPGATQGITVAGGNGRGSAPNQFQNPVAVFVNAAGSIYVADANNNRIQRWDPGASQGVTVAGGHGYGPAANQTASPFGLFVDPAGNVYTANIDFNRIEKWAPGATQGVFVAGGSGPGPTLSSPRSVWLDASGNIFVTDGSNDRVLKYAPGGTQGVVVAGGQGRGSAPNQLSRPSAVVVDASNDIYVCDPGNNRVQKFTAALGLSYKYYEGYFAVLPDFSTLSPVKTGRSSTFDIGIRRLGVNDSFAIVWEGDINIPTPGVYTFETVSDDGSKLYFNSGYSPSASPLVSNDSTHPPKSATGTINIPVAGKYPFGLTYFENYGAEGIQVYWSGPGIARQLIPDNAFTFAGDSIPPSVPANLRVVSSGGNFINLAWDRSTDNVSIAAYDVFVNGVKKYATVQSQFTVDSLAASTSYTFSVVARDPAGNTSGFSNAVTATTASTLNGLNYKYYEGVWNSLPNFNTLTPVKTGQSLTPDISDRPAGRDDNFAFVWEGYITIPAAGTYTFETISDDGSKIYFNSLYSPTANAVVSNDGLHAAAPVRGSIYVASPGSYPIAITFFEKDGGQTMETYWMGPGIARQLIPMTAFTLTDQSAQSSNLTYKYYEGSWNSLPDFSTLTPVKTGRTKNVDIAVRPAERNDNFAFLWEGRINIPAPGNYTFETNSDDGSRFYFNSTYSAAATPTVNNDGLHAPTSISTTINIPAAGSYPVAITFFEKDGGETMKLYWTGPGIAKQEIPDVAFGSAAPDTLAPAAPVNVRALYNGHSFVYLDWNNASDDASVIAYDIYVNGVKRYTSSESSFSADGLSASTAYAFSVRARDLNGNSSPSSNTATVTTAAANSGLHYRYYEGNWSVLPNFNTLTAVKSGSTSNVDISVRNVGVNDMFGFVWEGYINITTPGTYTFETISDDGSKVYFNSFYNPSAIATVNNDGLHPPSSSTGTVSIPTAGLYPIAITFFEKDSGEQMQLFWSGPGFSRQPIPTTAFLPSAPVLQATVEKTSTNTITDDVSRESSRIGRMYPNPFHESFNIDFYNTLKANDIHVGIYDLKGRLLYAQRASGLPSGNSTLKVNVSGQLPAGVYMGRLTINGVPSKPVKLIKLK